MLRQMTIFNIFSIFSEGKSQNDILQLFMQADLQMSVARMTAWTTTAGLGFFATGFLAQTFTPIMGPFAYCNMSLVSGTISRLIMGFFRTEWAMYVGLWSGAPAINATGTASVKSLATKHAMRVGMGAGEYSGQFSNVRALTYIFGPLIYSRFYAYLKQQGYNTSFAVYLISLVGYFIPLMMHLSWSRDEMDPFGKEEREKKKEDSKS